MSSKRARKAKKRFQREARRQTRRARAAAGAEHQEAQATPRPASPIVTAPEELAPYMARPAGNHRQARRAPHATRETTGATDLDPAEVIGYVAYDGQDFLRKYGECVVAASRAQMQRTASQVWPGTPVTIHAVTFDQFHEVMEVTGEVYCFDDASYARFVETARGRGMAVGDLQNNGLHLLFP
jgi:hypothetical protein